jgi:hypothetical protein
MPLDDGADERVDHTLSAAARRTPRDERERAPAALAMPRLRWPALRPIAITKYHREVVFASTIRFLTISTP